MPSVPSQSVTSGEITLRVVMAVLAMAAIVMIAAPVKNFLQEQVDRLFYGERYDLRNSLLDFGRTLSATTALDPLLDSLVSRLQEVMNVERVAIFVESRGAQSGYVVARSAGLGAVIVPPDFREMIRVRSAETGVVRADDVDLNVNGWRLEFLGATFAALLRSLRCSRTNGGGDRSRSFC